MCRDHKMLADRYHADLRVYAEAEQSLVKAIGATFAEALRRANRARLVFEKARDHLNAHINWHHCHPGAELIQPT
jgi:hypothetical protein